MRRPSLRPLPRPITLTLQWAISLGMLLVIALVLRDRFGAVSATEAAWPSPWAVLATVALFVVANELLVRGWLGLVSMGGARLDRRVGRWVWAKSQLARYAIGMAQVASRAIVARKYGLRPTTSAITTLLEVVWYTCINAVMVLATIPWWLSGTGLEWAAWLAVVPGVVVALALLSPGAFIRAALLLAKVPPLNRLDAADQVRDLAVTRGATARLTLLYVGNATIRLAGFLVLYVAVGGSLQDTLQVTGAFALGHLIGALAVFAPGGLGPREGVTAIVLAPVIGAGPVFMLVGATRLLELVAELLYAGLARVRAVRYARAQGTALVDLDAPADPSEGAAAPAEGAENPSEGAGDPPSATTEGTSARSARLTGRATTGPTVGTVSGRDHPT